MLTFLNNKGDMISIGISLTTENTWNIHRGKFSRLIWFMNLILNNYFSLKMEITLALSSMNPSIGCLI